MEKLDLDLEYKNELEVNHFEPIRDLKYVENLRKWGGEGSRKLIKILLKLMPLLGLLFEF